MPVSRHSTPHPTPRSTLKVWRTERLRPSARCATERPRRSPDREETPRPRLTRQDPALRSSLVSLPCKPWALVALGGVFAGDRLPTRPLLSLDYLASNAPTRASPWRAPRVSDGSLPLIQAVRSHRYGLGECHPLPFRSLSGQREGFRLRLRLCALASLNSRGMVIALDLHCAATGCCTARVAGSAHCVRRDRPFGLQGSWRAAKRPAAPRCGHYARSGPITAQSP